MTALIHRKRRFVEDDGALSQYGWSVIQSVWVAIGGATSGASSPSTDEFTIEPGAAATTLSALGLGDVLPGHAAHIAPHDVSPSAAPASSAHDVAPI